MLFLHKFLNSAKNDERGVWGSARLPRPDAGAPEPTRTADTRFRKIARGLDWGGLLLSFRIVTRSSLRVRRLEWTQIDPALLPFLLPPANCFLPDCHCRSRW